MFIFPFNLPLNYDLLIKPLAMEMKLYIDKLIITIMYIKIKYIYIYIYMALFRLKYIFSF